MSRSAGNYTDEELALLTPDERAGLLGNDDGQPLWEGEQHLHW